jgi:hypothetical protein
MDRATKKKKGNTRPEIGPNDEDGPNSIFARRYQPYYSCFKKQSQTHDPILQQIIFVAVVKFHPFSAMDPRLKAQYENLSRHLVTQSALATTEKKTNDHQYSREFFSLGWEKERVSDDQEGHEEPQSFVPAINYFISQRFQFVCNSLFTQFKD